MISLCKRRNAKKQCKKAVQNAMQKDVMQRKETDIFRAANSAAQPPLLRVSEAS